MSSAQSSLSSLLTDSSILETRGEAIKTFYCVEFVELGQFGKDKVNLFS